MLIHEKEITTIVSDFDGTIIKKGMTHPPERFYNVVTQALDGGIPFIAASGRQYDNLRRMLSPIADRINYICENGCLVVCNGEIIYKSVFPGDIAQTLLGDMAKYADDRVIVSGVNTCYLLDKNPDFVHYVGNIIGNHITLLQSFAQIPEPMLKISIHFEGGIPKEAAAFFHEKYDVLLQVVEGGNGWFDFNMKEACKGTALEILASHLGISTREMVVFGDNENDISMLKKAGISYVVSTAQPHIKKHADYVCENVEDILEDIVEFHCNSSTKRVQ